MKSGKILHSDQVCDNILITFVLIAKMILTALTMPYLLLVMER